jgi:hypothetical protein
VKESVQDITKWFLGLEHEHIVLGYGSLLSKDSRERYSSIYTKGVPITVSGFERAWVTRSVSEKQTYVGAVPKYGAVLNAQLVPASLNPALQAREKDYRFVRVESRNIAFNGVASSYTDELHHLLNKYTLWICETLDCHAPTEQYPVHQTYVDTCLSGCLEHGGVNEAKAFVETTKLWDHPRVNDRENPKYPRSANIDVAGYKAIDELLMCINQER